MSKKIIRLTESDLNAMVDDRVKKYVQEGNQIRYAQQDLMKMGTLMSSVGLRLQKTKHERLFLKMKDAIVALNNALVTDLRKDGQ